MSKRALERTALFSVLIASTALGNGVEVRDFARVPAFSLSWIRHGRDGT